MFRSIALVIISLILVPIETLASETKKYGAFTILHKPCESIGYTISNIFGALGPEWPIHILYTDSVGPYLQDNRYLSRLADQGYLKLQPTSDFGFNELTSIANYNSILVNSKFWESIPYEKILIFQTDSVICTGSGLLIEDFLHFDYLGAPWPRKPYGLDVGNGGFSLRTTSIMLQITQRFAYSERLPEDLYFALHLSTLQKEGVPVTLASFKDAERFAVELSRPEDDEPFFAVHRSRSYPWYQRSAVMNLCPESKYGVWQFCDGLK